MQRQVTSEPERIVEELEIRGFSLAASGLTASEIDSIRKSSGVLLATKPDAQQPDIVRAPCLFDKAFLDIALHPLMREVIGRMILGRIVLNQQNLVRNPAAGRTYSQARFHRDLPYQHFVSSRPLAINVLLAIDEFTSENGGTMLLPGSHHVEYYPSQQFVENQALQVEAPAGTLIFLNAMTYHAGGINDSPNDRIALNHVFASPLLRKQVDFNQVIDPTTRALLTPEARDLLDLPNPDSAHD